MSCHEDVQVSNGCNWQTIETLDSRCSTYNGKSFSHVTITRHVLQIIELTLSKLLCYVKMLASDEEKFERWRSTMTETSPTLSTGIWC